MKAFYSYERSNLVLLGLFITGEKTDVSDCKDNDWIFDANIYQFVMTPGAMSGNVNFVFRINASGSFHQQIM